MKTFFSRISLRLAFVVSFLLFVMMLTFSNYNHSYQLSVKEEDQHPRPNVDRAVSGTAHNVLTKVKVTNNPIFIPTAYTQDKDERTLPPHQISLQLGKQMPKEKPPANRFHWLYNDTTTMIYSAHYDGRDKVIKIIGFRHRFTASVYGQRVLCRYPDGSLEPMTDLHNVSVMAPRPGLEYNTWIWICKWKNQAPPAYLSLTTQSKQVLIDAINITYHIFGEGAERVKQPVLCVKPMVKNYSDEYQLREFLEISRLWGVNKIVLYPYSIDEPVIRPILNEYEREGLVDIHEWRPPVPLASLHAFGQKSHNQHCLYTYMYRYEWAAFIDLDELIVANTKFKSMEYMIHVAKRSLSKAGKGQPKVGK